MCDYSKTVIYKIICNDESISECYVGHTTNFKQRKSQHKIASQNDNKNLKVYQFIREKGGWDNFTMIEIETYPCQNKCEATKRERHFIELLKASLNTNIPSRSSKEYRQDNKEHIKLVEEKYKSSGRRTEVSRIRYINNKDEIKRKIQEWKDRDRDHFLTLKRQQYQKNKEEINNKKKEKYTCECGLTLSKNNRSEHLRSKSHIEKVLNCNNIISC